MGGCGYGWVYSFLGGLVCRTESSSYHIGMNIPRHEIISHIIFLLLHTHVFIAVVVVMYVCGCVLGCLLFEVLITTGWRRVSACVGGKKTWNTRYNGRC